MHKTLRHFILLGASVGLLISPAHGADIAIGKNIATQGNAQGATACVGCHGIEGQGLASAGYPRIGGLDAAYLVHQIESFKNGTRKNPIMEPIAKALKDSETQSVAAYYESLSPMSEATPPLDPELLARGRQLVEQGNWDKEIPSCESCHGPGTSGVGAVFPQLAGQHASYIESQIHAWRNGQRENDPIDLMKVVAERLSDEEIKAVAGYLSQMQVAE